MFVAKGKYEALKYYLLFKIQLSELSVSNTCSFVMAGNAFTQTAQQIEHLDIYLFVQIIFFKLRSKKDKS